ncbi:diguanylate cyclase (GGDEF)-like protein [Paraburkholderia sp. BL6665CI2N2]|uniref:bifunctional diguanylate cyclase/phosphodiesterase n=1 Tax=Paraburkholderia sp. BL6665CI2N2 TaxID=1938806 RepID=UPI0010D00360|nr:GGDEF domain-containing protein [Paraburkholderia sp. BL6665CI2N2]TDY22063.1 diguanylate cyclase (GGDEF)-like protein [Paraburkholderia sp. BL6665CI2N2]
MSASIKHDSSPSLDAGDSSALDEMFLRSDTLTRALRLIVSCNHAMMHAADEQTLLNEICQLAVDIGGYTMAWVGFPDPTRAGYVMPVSWSSGADSLMRLVSAGRGYFRRCLVTEALQQQVTTMDDDCEERPGKDDEGIIASDFRSGVAIPLLCDDKPIGALSIYSAAASGFGSKELRLFEAMTADLAFGIKTLRARKEHEAAKKKLDYLAYHDHLTGAPNRFRLQAQFTELTKPAVSVGRQSPMLLLDLDNFREINDAWGHDCGDKILVEVTERLVAHVGSQGIVCRHGGDEFAILLYNFDAARGLDRFVQELLAALNEPYAAVSSLLEVTASIGVAIHPAHAETLIDLTRAADAALQRIKGAGKSGYHVFSEDMPFEAEAQRALLAQLRQAIRRGEFVLHYQPKYDVQQKKIVSVEALIRWQHPVHGLIGPASFISLAEKTGLIVPIGDWVIDTACTQFAIWKKTGLPLQRIAINISAVQLRRGDLLKTVSDALRQSGLCAPEIELELTESTFLGDGELAFQSLRDLRTLGVKLSLDDFGTGYSSLSYLKTMRVDRLKIDRSFIHDIPGQADAEAIVKTIIQLSRNLNLAVTAEGVETAAQRQMLEEFECDEIQGYLISRPVPAEELPNLFSSPIVS